MASQDVWSVLDTCARKINDNTAHPDNFLSIQDDLAADFTSLTKTLYDLHKAREPARCKGSPLAQLVVENFDEEQIWQELELQNAPVLNYFEKEIRAALSNDMLTLLVEEEEEKQEGDEEEVEDENLDGEEEETGSLDGEEEEVEEHRQSSKKASAAEDHSDEDSDFDFDVAALEKREKQKALAKGSKVKVVPSEVDDKFFKLSEMESFLDDMDKREGKDNQDIHDVDYFQDLPSDGDEELDLEMLLAKKQKKTTTKSSRNLKYKDYFDAVEGAAAAVRDGEDDSMEDGQDQDQEEEDRPHSEEDEEEDEDNEEEDGIRAQTKKVTFDLSGDEDSEGEDLADIFGGKKQEAAQSQAKSAFEKRQEKMSERIEEMERAALAQKPWQLSGEVTAQTRPENSILEEDLDFERSARMAPAITEETTLQLEDIIKQRIKDQAFDDVVRKEKPKEEVFEYKKRLTLDHEKSKLSLAQVYEQEYLKQTQAKTEEEENPAHKEIQKLMDSLFLKLDALSNFHFTPKPSVPEVKVVSNLPSITMEEVAPVTASAATLLAPEEIKEKNKGGDLLGDSEKTATDKKRDRRHKKKVKHFKLKEKEKRNKLKAASSKQPSKGEMAENLKKLSKAGKATILKDEGKDKALRSSQAFFSQLQDQVKSQIQSAKDQSSKTKKHKELSASKLKL